MWSFYKDFRIADSGFAQLLPVVEWNHFILMSMKDEGRASCSSYLVDIIEALREEKGREPPYVISCNPAY